MATRICDITPCKGLTSALGNFIVGQRQDGAWSLHINVSESKPLEENSKVFLSQTGRASIRIFYCPFCGVRLEEIGTSIVKKYLSQKRGAKKADELADLPAEIPNEESEDALDLAEGPLPEDDVLSPEEQEEEAFLDRLRS